MSNRWLLLLPGGASIAGCSVSWRNTRRLYLRNQTASELRLTWTIPRASLHPGAPAQGPRDMLLDNYEHPLPVQSHPVAGDSLALTVTLAPGTRYLISSFAESFHHSDPDQHSVGGCTFLPCTLHWRSADGHRQQQVIQPRAWRSAQDQEAEQQLTKSYDLVRYLDYK